MPATPSNSISDILTVRLDLIAVTPEILRADMDLAAEPTAAHTVRLTALVNAEVPGEWPPQDWEPHVLDFVLRQLTEHPHTLGWTRLVALRGVNSGGRTLIGTVGAIPPGTKMHHAGKGEIEVGYGILPAYQRQGYATEALAGVMEWVRSLRAVGAFVAQTFPDLLPSIRVLEKSGFKPVGEGFEEGTILFRREESSGP